MGQLWYQACSGALGWASSFGCRKERIGMVGLPDLPVVGLDRSQSALCLAVKALGLSLRSTGVEVFRVRWSRMIRLPICEGPGKTADGFIHPPPAVNSTTIVCR